MKRSLYLHLKRSLDARMFSFQVHIFNARECVWKLAEKKVDESLLRKFSIWFAWFSKVYKLSFNILVYLEVLKKFLWWTKLNNIDNTLSYLNHNIKPGKCTLHCISFIP